jgi:hypothetical protein
MEAEASMGSNMPDLLGSMPPNRGTDTPASDEVKRTGLQPQVDAQEIHTKQKDEQDKILAIDASIERLDKEIPNGKDEKTPKVNKFRELWDKLKEKWDQLKMDASDSDQEPDGDGGLGDAQDPGYTDTMRQYPNMVPAQQNLPAGPGTFGMS